MNKLILLLLLGSAFFAHAQDIEVIQKFDTVQQSPLNTFTYLEDATDVNTLIHKAVIQISSNAKAGIGTLFQQAKIKAGDLNANSYRIIEFTHQEEGIRAVLDLYYADEISLKNNTSFQPRNTVYVFGSDTPGKIITCKVNGSKIELQPFTFYWQENKRGQEIKVSKGGVTGMTVWVTWEENKPARYITLSGFGISGGGVTPSGGAGIGFNTGRLSYIDTDFGRFLSVVMKPISSDSKR